MLERRKSSENMKISSLDAHESVQLPRIFERSAKIPELGLQLMHKRTPFSSNPFHAESEECELTVYTEMGKCLCVEQSVYVTAGISAFTFRPGEMHCGIHQPNNLHERYVIQIHPAKFAQLPGGVMLLRCFFDREAGHHNMIVLPYEEEQIAMGHLNHIFTAAESNDADRIAVMTADLILYLSILNRHYLDTVPRQDGMPNVLRLILSYMEKRFDQPIPVSAYAVSAGISMSTMERLFRTVLQMTPGQYLHSRRMECAKVHLKKGENVTSACFAAGFRDYSHFIAEFRKQTGMTPAQYRKCPK